MHEVRDDCEKKANVTVQQKSAKLMKQQCALTDYKLERQIHLNTSLMVVTEAIELCQCRHKQKIKFSFLRQSICLALS